MNNIRIPIPDSVRAEVEESQMDRATQSGAAWMTDHINNQRTVLLNKLQDPHNNINRMCTVVGEDEGARVWLVIEYRKDRMFGSTYKVQHIHTGRRMIVGLTNMTNLY